ncbi:MAG: sodium:calcium antiporter [Actinomycetes bacterium]
MTGLALLGLAAILLVAGAELFVENAASAAGRLGVSVLAVGVLLAGAEPEELVTSVFASLRDRPDLAAGDAIGANVTICALALGAAALARPLPVGRRVREYAVAAAGAGVLALVVLADSAVSRVEGALLVAAYAAVVALVWWREKAPPEWGELAEAHAGEEQSRGRSVSGRSQALGLLAALGGLGLMLAGGGVAVAGASRVVSALDLTDTAVGLTLLALATSAELFALVWSAARRGVGEIAVAGVVGSAAYNATATLGAAALARPLVVTGMTWPAVLAAALPLVVVGLGRAGRLGRTAGAFLCVTYAAYAVRVIT